MKLMESSIKTNLNIKKNYPGISESILQEKPMKQMKSYTLGSVTVIWLDIFTQIIVILSHENRKVSEQEISFVLRKLMSHQTTRPQIYRECLEHIPENLITKNYKDVVILKQDLK
ncbi:DUF1827 family protein [Enterococcus avium]|uniref:DUF1827 family protein n=1 Tax=Enterococcus avium TaxID=33945 RepID=UPI0025B0103F|nr:DUF1827 family protein [Enterococcus avium]MDN2638034.1 DUF1827 family protein [Enterococcus avium]